MKKIRVNLSYIDNWSVPDAINQIEQEAEQDLEIKMFSYGGSVLSGFELGKTIQDRSKTTNVDVAGMAASMGAVLLTFFDKVIASNTSQFLIHPVAAYNTKLKKNSGQNIFDTLSAKLNLDVFEEIAGKPLNEVIFGDRTDENDIWLTAEEAQRIGLVHEIYQIAPDSKNEIDSVLDNCPWKRPSTNTIEPDNNTNKMDVNKLKSEFPQVYASIFSEGTKSERVRIQTLNEYREFDAERVDNMIESGESVNASFIKEMAGKAKANAVANAIEEGNEGEVSGGTSNNGTTEESNEVKEIEAQNMRRAGIAENQIQEYLKS